MSLCPFAVVPSPKIQETSKLTRCHLNRPNQRLGSQNVPKFALVRALLCAMSFTFTIVFVFARRSYNLLANVQLLFRKPHFSELTSPCLPPLSFALALCQVGSLPDPSADTHTHYHGLLLRPHTLNAASHTGGLPLGEVVQWAMGFDPPPPPPTLIHIYMRQLQLAAAHREKLWATQLWQELPRRRSTP